MLEKESTEFIIAIAFTTLMIALVVSALAVHLVVSSKRLRKVHELAAAAIKFTPAFMTIVFDEHDRVADLKTQDPESELHFRKAWSGKKKEALSFLPGDLFQRAAGDSKPAAEHDQLTTPLKMPDDGILYIRWEMQNFTNSAGKTEFRLARGYNRTEELLQTQSMLKKLSAASSEREERERKRIADNLHDRLGEVVVTSKRLLAELKKKSSSLEFRQGLEELEGAIKEFSRGTHSLIYDLIPPVLYNVGLAAAIQAHADQFGKQNKLSIRVEDGLGDFHLNQDVAFFLYKAVLEFVRNAVKHGGADEIAVALSRTEQTIAVTVEDNGAGFVAEIATPVPSLDSGFGLFNIKNRAEYYGGDLVTENSSALGGGKVTVWVAHAPQKGGWESEG